MKRWEEIGNNRWKLTITPDDPEDDAAPSVYRGTKEEIAEMLAESQSHANKRIAELKRGTNGHASPEPRALTNAERLQTVAELNNPATVDKAVTRVIESVMGPVEEERQRRQRQDQDDFNRRAAETAASFADETAEWYPSEFNKETLARFMLNQGMDYTNREHYTQAFEKLSAAKLLQPKPTEAETETESEDESDRERNAPAPPPVPRTPARYSTGVTQRDISGLPPKPIARLRYTREQIANMSASDYKRLMTSDPELGRCVEYYARLDRQPRRRVG